jgi:Flp pilus assembly secretin CpaC
MLGRRRIKPSKTLHLHFIHQFAVKSAAAACAEALTQGYATSWRRVVMTSKMDRCGGATASRTTFGLLLLAAAMLLAAPAFASEAVLGITLDKATILKLPEKVATIVVGNPLIADVAVQSGGLVVVTGKGYGSTNIIVLDRSGTVLMERAIVVRGPSDQTVAVYRGMERETYSCTPTCERRITLGDSAGYFTATAAQSDVRNNQSTAAGTRGR